MNENQEEDPDEEAEEAIWHEGPIEEDEDEEEGVAKMIELYDDEEN